MLEQDITQKRKDRHHITQEDFTPPEVIEMLFKDIPRDLYTDFSKTFCDPCAGIGNILVYVLNRLISIYATIMLIYCLLGWFIRDRSNVIMRILSTIAEPPLVPIRRFLNRYYYFQQSPVDFSPLILFFLLRLLVSALAWLAQFTR